MYGPPPIQPKITPAYPPPFRAVPVAGPAPMPMREGPPAGLSESSPDRVPPLPASSGAAFTPGVSGLGSIGRLLPIVQSAGKWLPLIQKYGPMVRQIPGMVQKANQVSKALKHVSDTQASAPATEKNEEKQALEHFASNEIKEGAQPPPKLYV